MPARLLLPVAAAAVLAAALAACAASASQPLAPASASAPSPQATAPRPVPSGQPTAIPIWTSPDWVSGAPGNCRHADPCVFTGETYRTAGRTAFLPGLTMFIPATWYSGEHYAGEFSLNNPSFHDSDVLFWRDIVPVASDGSVIAAPSTVAGILHWLQSDRRLVVTEPQQVTIGHGLAATTVVVTVAKGTANMDPGCLALPNKATCFPILTDPARWDGAWWIASAHSERLFLAMIGPASAQHLFVVAVVGSTFDRGPETAPTPDAERERLEAAVQPILDSLDVSNVTFN